jgi:O-antigen/teichoic acid export membrane protein
MGVKRTLRSDFLKHSLVVVSGTVAAQAIVLIAQLFLRRMYSTADFGLFSLFVSITGIPVIVATMRYELAVVLPEKDEDAANLIAGGMFINLLFSILLFLIILPAQSLILQFLNVGNEFLVPLYLAPAAVFFYGTYQLLNYWFIRRKRFMTTSYIKVQRRSTEAFSQSVLSYVGTTGGLILGELIGRALFACTSIYYLFKNGFSLSQVSFRRIRELLIQYKDFPLHSALPSLLNSAGLLFPAIVVNRLFDEDITGRFDLCLQVLAVPVSFISVSISNVLLEKIAAASRNGQKIVPLILKLSAVLAVITIPGFILGITVAPDVFAFVFGETYRVSGEYTQILMIGYAARFIVSPLAIIFTGLNKIRSGIYWQYAYFLSISALFLLKDLSIHNFLWIYSLMELGLFALYFIQIVHVSYTYDSKISS